MPPAPVLTEDELRAALDDLPGWTPQDERIVKTFRFRDFAGALDFLNRVAQPAEEQDHHPDVAIHWNELTLTLWTHASGGITRRDVRLAHAIEQLAGAR